MPINFGDLTRVEPVSRLFGLERGTPIDRYYIHRFIDQNAESILGKAIEVGELRYLQEYGAATSERCILTFDREMSNPKQGASKIIIGNLTAPATLPENAFDCFICTQTLNFIFDAPAAVRGAHRLLAPSGIFLGTVAGLSQISRYDMDRWGDYWRFTTLSLARILSEVFGRDLAITSFGNAFAAQALLQGLAIEDLPRVDLLDVKDDDYQLIIGFKAKKVA